MPIRFDKILTPTTMEEAVGLIVGKLNDDERAFILDRPHDQVLGMTHHSFGMAMRNGWKLWEAGSPLSQHFRGRFGLGHADDMSGLIMGGVVAQVKGEQFDVDAKVASYKAHWARYGVDPLTQGKTK